MEDFQSGLMVNNVFSRVVEGPEMGMWREDDGEWPEARGWMASHGHVLRLEVFRSYWKRVANDRFLTI